MVVGKLASWGLWLFDPPPTLTHWIRASLQLAWAISRARDQNRKLFNMQYLQYCTYVLQ